jgi:hypothetical protein
MLLYWQSLAGRRGATGHVPRSGRSYLCPLMNRAQKAQYWCWLAILFAALAYFWTWWLRPEHNIGTFSYVINAIILAWLTLLPFYFILIQSRARPAITSASPTTWLSRGHGRDKGAGGAFSACSGNSASHAAADLSSRHVARGRGSNSGNNQVVP